MLDSFNSKDLYGFGGWLIWFQFGLLRSIFNLLISPQTDPVIAVIFIALIVICLIFFYSRKLLFRLVYIAIIVLIIIIGLRALPHSLPYIIGQAVDGGIVTIALFKSERVRNTFS